jgi:hypothetical protein
MRDGLAIKKYKVYRKIIPTLPLRRIDQSREELLKKLKACIYRKDLFVKRSNHDNLEYVDIQAILKQGLVVVSDELKNELGNFLKLFSFQAKYNCNELND